MIVRFTSVAGIHQKKLSVICMNMVWEERAEIFCNYGQNFMLVYSNYLFIFFIKSYFLVTLILSCIHSNLQQASLRIWDEERGQDENSRRDKPVVPNKVIIFSSHLTDPDHIEKYLQKDR